MMEQTEEGCRRFSVLKMELSTKQALRNLLGKRKQASAVPKTDTSVSTQASPPAKRNIQAVPSTNTSSPPKVSADTCMTPQVSSCSPPAGEDPVDAYSSVKCLLLCQKSYIEEWGAAETVKSDTSSLYKEKDAPAGEDPVDAPAEEDPAAKRESRMQAYKNKIEIIQQYKTFGTVAARTKSQKRKLRRWDKTYNIGEASANTGQDPVGAGADPAARIKIYKEKIKQFFIYKQTGKYPEGITNSQGKLLRRWNKTHKIEDGKVYYLDKDKNTRLCVTTIEEIKDILISYHSASISRHSGYIGTFKKIKKKYFWEGMTGDIYEFISTCNICQKHKKIEAQDPTLRHIKIKDPLELVEMMDSLPKRKKRKMTRKVSFKDNLSGKVAVVTGASTGIGRATAIALAKQGVKVALAARGEEVLLKAVQEIRGLGGTAIGVKTDVRVREQVEALAREAESKLGHVDILVNSAGVWHFTLMTNLKQDAWEEMIDINCKGVLNSIAAVLTSMVERKTGHIINISSDSGKRPFEGIAVYGGTKYFVEGMTACMRREVAKHNIRITNIQPGEVDTPGCLRPPIDPEAAEMYDASSHKVLELEDIARAVVYAASQPSYVAVNEVLVQPTQAPL